MSNKKGKGSHKKAKTSQNKPKVSHNEVKMSHTVVGLFNNRNSAQTAKQELIQQGFTAENIDVSHKAATGSADTATTQIETTESATTQIEITDSVGNFFASLFGNDETTARNYTDAAGEADAILTVHTDSDERARQVVAILDHNGAIDIDAASPQHAQRNLTETTETTSQNTAHSSETPTRKSAQTAKTTDHNHAKVQNETAIPVIEEQLLVGKREVESGGARIRSRIIEKPVEASVRLREEHVVVNRRPVNRAVTDADLASVKEGDIQITESAEVPVIAKEARVVEEVVVGKNVTERQETIRDKVKRTDVDVEEVNIDTTARSANNKS
jgi:uncharacterized protein (TIGR02271 family)